MTNTALLNSTIDESGYKRRYLASELGISYQAFNNKVYNKSEFLPSEITVLCILLKITSLERKDAIFFAPDGD